MVATLIILNVAMFVAQLVLARTISFSEFREMISPAALQRLSERELRQEYEALRARGQLPRISRIEDWLALDGSAVMHGQIWRLTTYDFLHDTSSPWHLVFNMWLLWLAGRRVESYYGRNEFLAFYLAAGVLSGIVFLLWGLLIGGPGIAIGASGAAVAVMIVYALHWPNERWYLWGILPIPVIVLALIGAGLDLYPMLLQLQGRGGGDGIAHSAHIGGMVFGFLYVQNRWRLTGASGESRNHGVSRFKRLFRRRPKLNIHTPEVAEPPRREPLPAADEARLDALLEKIAQQGEASLTDDERRFLTETSRRMRPSS